MNKEKSHSVKLSAEFRLELTEHAADQGYCSRDRLSSNISSSTKNKRMRLLPQEHQGQPP